ncbi:hypothetical protein EsH8_III_000574 [Colletotrichum jinshuiense]
MAKDSVLEGVFAINKPYGMSSAQVIRDAQTQFNPSDLFKPLIERDLAAKMQESKQEWKRRRAVKKDSRVKMGHGGTLDPLATGVLILGVGSGTKSLGSFLDCTKTYETVVLFGASTDTYDRVGRILSRRPYDEITKEKVEEAMESFRGKFQQIPPLYSALKMEGKPLYEYAREGKAIPREIVGRDVDVTELEMVEWYEPGTHNYRWPTEEAETAEKNLAEQVWRVEKQQGNRKLSPDEEKEEEKAISEHESVKKKFDERQDGLIRDKPAKKQRPPKNPALMSGALGQLPAGKGSNLIPPPPSADEPFPWTDKGPPAAKIRMTVTSGFYVRSFCHDLGAKVNSAAMMAELERSRQGDFEVRTDQCLEYSDLLKGQDVWGPKVSQMLSSWAEKYPAGAPQSQREQRNNQNQQSQGRNNHNKKRKWEDNKQSDKNSKKRRNSSSGDEADKPAAKLAKTDEAKVSPKASPKSSPKAKTPDTKKAEEAEWDGIKD